MAMTGMDVEQVEALGHRLQSEAQQIEALINSIENTINELEANWKGQDATEFRGWWENQHKPAMVTVKNNVNGLGQSAINNAGEQRQVSSH